ncbi:MAG: hypothetical protein ABIA12_00200 [Candidatus Aenigmatarchaeota archaeon]
MEPYSGRLFRTLEYRSRLRGMAASGPLHAAYFSEHPDELASRVNDLKLLEKDVAAAELEGCDREALLSEIKSCRKGLNEMYAEVGNDFFGQLKPTGRDIFVAAASAVAAAYAARNGRAWFKSKVEGFCRRQAEYIAEELNRVK